LRFQVSQEAVERLLKRVVVFPLAEVADVARPADVGCPSARTIHHRIVEPYRKQYGCALPLLFLEWGLAQPFARKKPGAAPSLSLRSLQGQGGEFDFG
jgi:hypothetical protein